MRAADTDVLGCVEQDAQVGPTTTTTMKKLLSAKLGSSRGCLKSQNENVFPRNVRPARVLQLLRRCCLRRKSARPAVCYGRAHNIKNYT